MEPKSGGFLPVLGMALELEGLDIPAMINILGISGSLRAQSSNADVLRAAAALVPPGVRLTLFQGLGALPPFNPDLDGEVAPPHVEVLREMVGWADALLICSPEYAHGIPGSLKNALDWLVRFSGVVGKPVALLNASPRAQHGPAALAETVRTMAMAVIPAASITLPVTSHVPSATAMADHPEFRAALRAALDALIDAVREYRTTEPLLSRR